MTKIVLNKGDRVSAIKSGYGKGAGARIEGTVQLGTTTTSDYIRIKWDDGSEDFGFARLFRELQKIT